jgi:hypothetical protein
MRGRSKIVALVVSAVALVIAIPVASSAHPRSHDFDPGRRGHAIKHVLLISVDGLHQSDFPGMAALATGGNPHTTGIYYDADRSEEWWFTVAPRR